MSKAANVGINVTRSFSREKTMIADVDYSASAQSICPIKQ